MRIITGRYKGVKLYTVPGISTRPTTDFNREIIFSMYPDYEGQRVLDLFAGTGSFGLETLSRGASWVDFVEFASPAIGTLLQNIEKLRCGEQCHVHRRRVEQYLKTCEDAYDVIFLDPPYNKGLVSKCLEAIIGSDILSPDGIVIVEHSPREEIEAQYSPLFTDHKQGKTTCFTVLAPKNEDKKDIQEKTC